MSKLRLAVFASLLLLTGVISPLAGQTTNEQSETKIANASRIQQILSTARNRKVPTLPEDGKVYGDHSVECSLNIPEKWRMNISLSNNRRFVFLVFPCTNPDKANSEIFKRLMIENRRMGLMRFEYSPSSNLISLVCPLANKNLDFDSLDEMTRELVSEARRTEPLWSKVKNKMTNKTAPKGSSKDTTESDEETDVSESKKKQPSAETVADRMAKKLHDALKSDLSAKFSYKNRNDNKTYLGDITFKTDGTYLATSKEDKKSGPDTGKWEIDKRGIRLIPTKGLSIDLFTPSELEAGAMKVKFRYAVPTTAPAAGATPQPTPANPRLSGYIRVFVIETGEK